MKEETRQSYAGLWRGILQQEEALIKESSEKIGTDVYEIFTSVVTNRRYEDVMDASKKRKLKARLGDANSTRQQR